MTFSNTHATGRCSTACPTARIPPQTTPDTVKGSQLRLRAQNAVRGFLRPILLAFLLSSSPLRGPFRSFPASGSSLSAIHGFTGTRHPPIRFRLRRFSSPQPQQRSSNGTNGVPRRSCGPEPRFLLSSLPLCGLPISCRPVRVLPIRFPWVFTLKEPSSDSDLPVLRFFTGSTGTTTCFRFFLYALNTCNGLAVRYIETGSHLAVRYINAAIHLAVRYMSNR